jgi:hypothetical protein
MALWLWYFPALSRPNPIPSQCAIAGAPSRLSHLFHGEIVTRTLGILAPADLDELLDIGDFGRHLG